MSEPNSNLLKVYEQLCSSYQEIDSFRAQLLGRLPLVTGTGIFLLYVTGKEPLPPETKAFLPAIGLFGFVVTLGLFAYEAYGIMKCHALIIAGKQMEAQLGVDGQFAHRPRSVLDRINEPFAAGVIYPAVLASWAFVALAFVEPNWLSWFAAALVLFAAFGLSLYYNEWLEKDGAKKNLELLNMRILQSEEKGDAAFLAPLLKHDIDMVDSQGRKPQRLEFLRMVPANAHRGREADRINVELHGKEAVFKFREITSRDAEGNELFKFFRITRHFEKDLHRPDQSWICTSWHEREIQEDAIEPSTN
jgi:hypothetical protein